ncbi:3-methylfumaryl-CoA hydratase [Tistlia consotensis]|uniref:3-methylfumaryl-CoA hydratase n=1 Tax=Tistlia consotensis USBA 355 TaxID=560819 RepID=A0A1Y6CG99_9PROT|nr:MaoC family dehydratase N-terminal domain-containing protein [Tistlia consotensis]SMF62447.1 3-methylfumaryl-CoA hydratase [Tistlia consotensis USBA 355]SNR94747.1 3-methylfumaryl-CoA hydratase [Tistlia consotensis]
MSGDFQDWIGRERLAEDRIDLNRAEGLRVTLESPDPAFAEGRPLPELWHWAYFWEFPPLSGVGPDGHAARGEFLPPLPLPRRMWAGSRLTWHAPLPVGAAARRTSTILKVEQKTGRSGRLAFVTVGHRIEGPGGLAIEEEHDIVYREAAQPGAPPAAGPAPAPAEAPWRREIRPTPVLLFRYSALTFNGHRIHYDQPYATGVEGYPGLIVHGPLLATLMVDLARREAPGRRIAGFAFRARSPIFDTAPFAVCGAPSGDAAAVWVAGPQGELAMQGEVTFG